MKHSQRDAIVNSSIISQEGQTENETRACTHRASCTTGHRSADLLDSDQTVGSTFPSPIGRLEKFSGSFLSLLQVVIDGIHLVKLGFVDASPVLVSWQISKFGYEILSIIRVSRRARS